MFNVQHPDDWCAWEQDYTELQELKQTMAEDKTDMWRAGFIEEEALGFAPDVWIRGHAITIKPGESIQEIEAQLTQDYGTRVRIVIPEWQEEA